MSYPVSSSDHLSKLGFIRSRFGYPMIEYPLNVEKLCKTTILKPLIIWLARGAGKMNQILRYD